MGWQEIQYIISKDIQIYHRSHLMDEIEKNSHGYADHYIYPHYEPFKQSTTVDFTLRTTYFYYLLPAIIYYCPNKDEKVELYNRNTYDISYIPRVLNKYDLEKFLLWMRCITILKRGTVKGTLQKILKHYDHEREGYFLKINMDHSELWEMGVFKDFEKREEMMNYLREHHSEDYFLPIMGY